MPTLVHDPPPAAFEELLEQRRRSGADRWDEVWEGVLHMIPPPSHQHQRLVIKLGRLLDPLAEQADLEVTAGVGIGINDDHRVPDLALHRPGPAEQWHPTAALAVEIISPEEDPDAKLPFYAKHGVDEVLIVDTQLLKVRWLGLGDDGRYRAVERSGLIELSPVQLAKRLGWPS